MKKSKKKIVVFIIIILLIGIAAGGAYVYFFTDLLKTNKQKFFKYLGQNLENIESLKSEELINYFEKKEKNAYENKGEFYATINKDTAKMYMPNTKVYDETQKFKITFEGQKDLPNDYLKDTINLQYSNGEKMTFELAKQDDYYGLKVDGILKKYLTIENNNLKQFAQKLGIEDTSNIPDKIEIKDYSKYKFTEKEWKSIESKIYKTLDENLNDSMFKEENNEIFTLTITNQQIEDIMIKLCDMIINDETIMNKVKNFLIEELSYSEQEINNKIEKSKSRIQEYLNKEKDIFENINEEEGTISINVYKKYIKNPGIEIYTKSGKISLDTHENEISLVFLEGDENVDSTNSPKISSIKITKTAENDNVIFDYELYTSNNMELKTKIKFTGLEQEHSKEEYTFNINLLDNVDDIKLQYDYINNIEFYKNIEKEDLKENSSILNNYDSEKLMTTFQKLGERIAELNKSQMKALELKDDQNPLLYIHPSFSLSNNILSSAKKSIATTSIYSAQEDISLELMDISLKYITENVQNNQGIDKNEYIDKQLSSNEVMEKINSSLKKYNVTATYDKNIGLTLTSDNSKSSCIGRLDNGKIVWGEIKAKIDENDPDVKYAW